MTEFKAKIFFSEIGGIFIAKNIQSGYQTNRLISIILSFQDSFQITPYGKDPLDAAAALISPNIKFKIRTNPKEFTAFIHIDPYSKPGLRIKRDGEIIILPRKPFQKSIQELDRWILNSKISSETTADFLLNLIDTFPDSLLQQKELDPRIARCIEIISKSDSIDFATLSRSVSLSTSRLSHLFKEETNITLRQYIQHRKLIKSIHGLHKNFPFSEAALLGGFSDQSHFINIFKKMFGIIPSKTRQ